MSSWKHKVPGELLMFIKQNGVDVDKITYSAHHTIPIYTDQIMPNKNKERDDFDMVSFRHRIEIRLDELLQYIIEHNDYKRLCNYFLNRPSFIYGISAYFLSTQNQSRLYGIYRVKLGGLLSDEIEYTLDPIICPDTNEFLGTNISCQTMSDKIISRYGF